ncbi:MAG: porin family protein [Alphaproteobacteria bacterium]|nr:porin family protein [Alphaproteobacteria bacterium]
MKKLLVLTSVVAVFSAASASAKTEGRYVGVDLLRGNVSYAERYSDNSDRAAVETSDTQGEGVGLGVRLSHAYNSDGVFVAPGVFAEHNNVRADGVSTQRLQVNNRVGVKADIGYDMADNVAPYLTVGYAAVDYRTRNNDGVTGSKVKNGLTSSWFYGVGLKIDVNKSWAFNAEYQTQDFRAKTRTGGTDNYSGVFKSNFNEVKLGASYKF